MHQRRKSASRGSGVGKRSRSWRSSEQLELEQENAGLQQRNRDLLQSPFGKRSEKRQSGSGRGGSSGDGPHGGGSRGAAAARGGNGERSRMQHR